ncbi:MAG TPA: hypothetical protein VH092_34310 [Urbifossiella sp.]|nr:hypothetical protein [Urbifossiella sp.]
MVKERAHGIVEEIWTFERLLPRRPGGELATAPDRSTGHDAG